MAEDLKLWVKSSPLIPQSSNAGDKENDGGGDDEDGGDDGDDVDDGCNDDEGKRGWG